MEAGQLSSPKNIVNEMFSEEVMESFHNDKNERVSTEGYYSEQIPKKSNDFLERNRQRVLELQEKVKCM